jgi:DNA topoisomerase-1
MDTAIMVLSLPRDLGLHPVTNKKIIANIGRFGPYINHDAKFKSIPKTQSVFTIDLESAVTLLAQANTGPAPLCSLGNHPTEDGQIEVYAGRYGPYVQHGKIRATLPKSVEPESLTLDEALELLNAKAAKEVPAKKASTRKTVAKKTTTAKKTSTAKTVVKKVVAKKASPKKPAPKKPAI